MSEPTALAQEALPIFTGGLKVHPGGVGGNGIGHATLPARLPHHPPKPEHIPTETIRKELECVLDSPEFRKKPMLRGFLSFVVEETLAGRSHEIKGYTVATQVFGRRTDFDPAIDPIVRIQAGRLRRTLESYYCGRGRHDRLRIEIGKGSYIPTFSQPSHDKLGLVRSQRPDGTRPAVELFLDPAEIVPLKTGTGTSVAVMPIINLTNDPAQEYMADGLTEELMSELACCHGLQVTGEAGRQSGVKFFIEGSLRKEGPIIKFTLRLVEVATRMQIWGDQYKRDLGSEKVIDLQEEIARNVARRVGGLFGAIPQRLTKESRSKAPRILRPTGLFSNSANINSNCRHRLTPRLSKPWNWSRPGTRKPVGFVNARLLAGQ